MDEQEIREALADAIFAATDDPGIWQSGSAAYGVETIHIDGAVNVADILSSLSEAGFSITKLPKPDERCRDKYPLSDPALICQRESGHALSHEALDASCDRFRWPNAAAAEGEKP